jgi:hypothetical protein
MNLRFWSLCLLFLFLLSQALAKNTGHHHCAAYLEDPTRNTVYNVIPTPTQGDRYRERLCELLEDHQELQVKDL